MSLFWTIDAHYIIVATAILGSGACKLIADQSEELKLPQGFWTKSDTWQWKYARKWPWKYLDGWHIMSGRMADLLMYAIGVSICDHLVHALVAALVGRVLWSLGQRTRIKA